MPLTEFTSPDVREWLEYDTFSAVNHGNNTGRLGEWVRAAGTGWTDETILLFDIASILFSTITNVDLEITCNSKGGQTIAATGIIHKQNKNSPLNWFIPEPDIDFDTPFAVSAWTTALVTLANMLNTGVYTFLNTTSFKNEVQAWLTSNPKNNWGLIAAINFAALGWYLSLDSLKLKVTHTLPSSTVWGGKYVGYISTGLTACRLMGGTSPTPTPGKKLVVKSISVYVGDTHSEQLRLALYQGGTLDNPAGATLKYDFGQTSGSGIDQWLTITHPTGGIDIVSNEVTWLAVKSNGGGFEFHSVSDSGKSYDMQSARGRWNSTSMSTDETAIYESSVSSGGSFNDFWYPIVIQYDEVDSGIVIPRRRMDIIQSY